jgi:hypothetical protein
MEHREALSICPVREVQPVVCGQRALLREMIEPVCPVPLKGRGSIIEEYVPSAQFNASVGLEEKAKFTGFNARVVYGHVGRHNVM